MAGEHRAHRRDGLPRVEPLFEALVEEAGVPAATPTLPPADIQPPDDIDEIVRRHGNEVLD